MPELNYLMAGNGVYSDVPAYTNPREPQEQRKPRADAALTLIP